MHKFKFVFILSVVSSAAYSNNLVRPGSPYCESVIQMERIEYNLNIKPKLQYLPEVLKDIRAILRIPTEDERNIMEVEGSLSYRMKDMQKRIYKHNKEQFEDYDKKDIRKYVDYKADYDMKSAVLDYQFKNVKDGSTWIFKINLSTIKEEEASIAKQISQQGSESLEEHLTQKVDPKCFKKEDLHINADERSPGKDTPAPANKEKKKSKFGASKI